MHLRNILEKLSIKIIEKLSSFITLKFNHIESKGKVIVRGIPYIKNKGSFKIGENVIINSMMHANPIGGDRRSIFIVKPNAELIIDDNVGISNSAIVCWKKIYIGKNVMIGGGCKIYDTDFHSLILEKRLAPNDSEIKTSPIEIQSGAFIGAHSIILKGVTIGKNSVIGAGSVVTRNIPPNEIWAGNPVKFIRKL